MNPVQRTFWNPDSRTSYFLVDTVNITYIDAKGDETTRMITPLHVQVASGVVYLIAYCHLRQAERNFRLDRIFAIDRIE